MENDNIIGKFAKDKHPFRTPEGYFESFTERTMQRIHQQQLPSSSQQGRTIPLNRWRPARWIAAASIAAITVAAATCLYSSLQTNVEATQAYSAETLFNDDMLEQALDYEIAAGIVDNNKISYYLTEAE